MKGFWWILIILIFIYGLRFTSTESEPEWTVEKPPLSFNLYYDSGCAYLVVDRTGEQIDKVTVDMPCLREEWPDAEVEIIE